MLKQAVKIGLVFTLSSCSILSSEEPDKPGQFLAPSTIQEDSWSYKYTTTELPGNKIKDGVDSEISAAGQWVILNFAVTNTADQKQDTYESLIELEETILTTSDGQEWNYPEQIYDYGITTIQPGQSYNLKLAYDVPNSVNPKTLIYRFYDEDFNRIDFKFDVGSK